MYGGKQCSLICVHIVCRKATKTFQQTTIAMIDTSWVDDAGRSIRIRQYIFSHAAHFRWTTNIKRHRSECAVCSVPVIRVCMNQLLLIPNELHYLSDRTVWSAA